MNKYSHYVEYEGESVPFLELMKDKGLYRERYTIRARVNKGWDLERAMTTPIKRRNYKALSKHKDQTFVDLLYRNLTLSEIAIRLSLPIDIVANRIGKIILNRKLKINDNNYIPKESSPYYNNEWEYGRHYPKYNYNEVKLEK